jgi:hypothetical protein
MTEGTTVTTTIERWIRDWYGLTLHTDRPDFELYVSTTGMLAAAHAAGFTTALGTTDAILAAQLASNGRGIVDPPVRLLAAARDLAWQAINAFAAAAHAAGFASLPTGANRRWTPVCVHTHVIGSKAYPALANTRRPDAPVRLTRTTAERISTDLAAQHGQRISLNFTGDVLTISHGEPASIQPTRHEPDTDGLYAIGAGSLHWQRTGDRQRMIPARPPFRYGYATARWRRVSSCRSSPPALRRAATGSAPSTPTAPRTRCTAGGAKSAANP